MIILEEKEHCSYILAARITYSIEKWPVFAAGRTIARAVSTAIATTISTAVATVTTRVSVVVAIHGV